MRTITYGWLSLMQSLGKYTEMKDSQVSVQPPLQLPPGREVLSLVWILLGCSQPSLDGFHQAYLKSISKGFAVSTQDKTGTK